MLLAEELLLYHDPSCVCSPKTLVVKLHLIAYTGPIQQSRQRTNSMQCMCSAAQCLSNKSGLYALYTGKQGSRI